MFKYILMQDYFSKKIQLGFYWRFSLFYFLEEKSLEFILLHNEGMKRSLPLVSLLFIILCTVSFHKIEILMSYY